jgi:hypothetical protein
MFWFLFYLVYLTYIFLFFDILDEVLNYLALDYLTLLQLDLNDWYFYYKFL